MTRRRAHRRRRHQAGATSRSRAGFGLIEVMVALVVITIGMLGLAGMLMQVARRATLLSVQNGRSAVGTQVMNRLAALPYDQLTAAAGCTNVPSVSFPHTECISVIDAAGGAGYKSIRLIVTPANPRVRPDTTYLIRSP